MKEARALWTRNYLDLRKILGTPIPRSSGSLGVAKSLPVLPLVIYRRQQRWNRDGLGTTRDGASLDPMLPDSAAPLAFDQIEWQLTCNQVLNSKEACVIQQRYWQTATQRQAANTCAMSQSMVHRVHQQALVKLRRALR